MKETADRHEEREECRRIEARSVKVDGIEEREEVTRSRYPKRIAELVNSLRKYLYQRPVLFELEQDYDDRGIEHAAGNLYWAANLFNHIDLPLNRKEFSKEEAEEALRILLKEKEIQEHVLVPPEERARERSVSW